jgi:hypothetical protein
LDAAAGADLEGDDEEDDDESDEPFDFESEDDLVELAEESDELELDDSDELELEPLLLELFADSRLSVR